jgi:hypothetical protein
MLERRFACPRDRSPIARIRQRVPQLDDNGIIVRVEDATHRTAWTASAESASTIALMRLCRIKPAD